MTCSSPFSVAVVVACALPACVPFGASMPTQTWQADEPTETCTLSSLSDPLLGEHWSYNERATLEAKLTRNEPVVVSAIGCSVDVLAGCETGGQYSATSLAPREKLMPHAETISDVRYDLNRSDVTSQSLRGNCDRATHVVTGVIAGDAILNDSDERERAALFVELTPLSIGNYDLGGTWRGTMRQPRGPYEVYDLVVDLEQDRDRVHGTTHISTIDGEWWGRMRFEGRLEGNTLYYADAQWLGDNLVLLEWCMKGGYALVDPNNDRLEGLWRAFACAPGSVELTRED